jgi:DNA-directed RNA polymerase subunit RPC12/RpoP
MNPSSRRPVGRVCPKCGHRVGPGAAFCGKCGAPIPKPSEKPPLDIRCPECGAVLRAGATFCGKCGHSLQPFPPKATIPAKPEPGKCPNCGRDVKDTWRACPYCSTKLIFECPECGERVERHWRVCPYCETELSTAKEGADTSDEEDS